MQPKPLTPDPQDATDAGKGHTPCQMKALKRVIARIGKAERPAYQGARSYQMLDGEA